MRQVYGVSIEQPKDADIQIYQRYLYIVLSTVEIDLGMLSATFQ